MHSEPPVENALNAMTDQDWAWWPFVELRPQTHTRMDTRRVAKMSLHYGPLIAMILLVPCVRQLALGDAVSIVASSIALTFLIWRFTFAIAWNRRAARIAKR
ncbi:MAG TPA: hypothetical protein VF407_18770 [Polyangiaceae bacterium]